MEKTELIKEIKRLKQEKNAIILGHYYLDPELQEVADYLGDSYGLSVKASGCTENIIVFAGVIFMAETAKILNPHKKVLAVNPDAGCPMADMINSDDIRKMREKIPGLYVVSYVNSSADVKTQSDICVTSRNALDIVRKLPSDIKDILFVPDRNLGSYIIKKTGRNMILWDGYCCVHDNLIPEEIDNIRKVHKGSVVIVHPECRPEVIEKADCAMSTSGMVSYAEQNPEKIIIAGTEKGVVHEMRRYAENSFALSENTICGNMKKNTLSDLYDTLRYEKNEILLSDFVLENAYKPIKRMIEYTESLKS